MDAKQDILIHEETTCSSIPHEPADDNKWNRDLAVACEALRSLDSRQICPRCQDIMEVVYQQDKGYKGVHQIDHAFDDTACGLCNAVKCTERRHRVELSQYNLDTGEIIKDCLCLYQVKFSDGDTVISHQILDSRRPWFDPWPRYPLKVDLQHLKRSIEYCKRNHNQTCWNEPRIPVSRLRLLNCTNRVIERPTADAEYVALSYVWGVTTSKSSPRSGDQGTYALTVEDAIVVTLNLGYTYLWVDQLCIDQGGSHMEEQLGQMDLIYQNADLTIVAAAGDDSSHGLPGISTSRTPRISFRNGSILYYEVKRTTQELIENSKWDTRAWTFQEWIFSRRRLVFTETESLFLCNALSINDERGSESAPFSALFDYTIQAPHIVFDPSFIMLPNGIQSVGHWNIGAVINMYATKSLTYSSDALNAIEGVFRALQRPGSPTYNYWGIPVEPKESFGLFREGGKQIPHSIMALYMASVGKRWEQLNRCLCANRNSRAGHGQAGKASNRRGEVCSGISFDVNSHEIAVRLRQFNLSSRIGA